MIVAYMTKPLVGKKFTFFQNVVINIVTSNRQQECVEAETMTIIWDRIQTHDLI